MISHRLPSDQNILNLLVTPLRISDSRNCFPALSDGASAIRSFSAAASCGVKFSIFNGVSSLPICGSGAGAGPSSARSAQGNCLLR